MNGCPPPPEDSAGGSSLTVTGPCAFEHKGTVSCERLVDDFYLTTTRKAAQGTTLTFFVNVEHYNGPGSYKDAQMFVSVMNKKLIYQWSSDTVDITVGPEEAFAVLPTTQLLAEPLLVDCSGPMTNYQCGGRGDPTVFTDTYEIVAGTLKCEAGGDKKP